MPTLTGITIYPVKSLDGLSLSESLVLPCGALANDRRWQLVDAEGQVVNAKRTARFHLIRAAFSLADLTAGSTVELSGGTPDSIDSVDSFSDALPGDRPHVGRGGVDGGNTITLWLDEASLGDGPSPLARETFPLVPGREGPCGWLSEALAEEVFLHERVEGGFPDDRDAAGATLVSTESLIEVARWFDWDLAEARRRFRMNLELTGDSGSDLNEVTDKGFTRSLTGPFWEDTLACPARAFSSENITSVTALSADPYADLPPTESRACSIGDAQFLPKGACRRCVVPSRDSHTGGITALFRDAFEARRSRGFRADVDGRHWTGYFRLGLNTVGGEKSACRAVIRRNADVLLT